MTTTPTRRTAPGTRRDDDTRTTGSELRTGDPGPRTGDSARPAGDAPTPSARIFAAATAWPGVTLTGPGERGEMSLMLGRHEVGHLHGDRVAHFHFGMSLGRRLRDEGHVVAHPVTDKPNLGARRIDRPGDVEDVLELLGLNYERLVDRYGLPDGAASTVDSTTVAEPTIRSAGSSSG